MPSHLPPATSVTKAGPLPSAAFPRHRRYYEPLGLPLVTAPLHLRLIDAAFARRGPTSRVSPVPYWAVATCPPPYPGSVLRPSGTNRHDRFAARGYRDPRNSLRRSLLPSPCHERLGRLHLSAIYVTRLQGSRLRIGPVVLLPSAGSLWTPEGFRHSTQIPRFLSAPGVCYAAHRCLPRRDFHPQVQYSRKLIPSRTRFRQDVPWPHCRPPG